MSIMPFARDPLSVALDDQAAEAITRAIAAHKSSRRKTDPRWVPVVFTSPAGYDTPGESAGGVPLTRMEIAWKRALYYDSRIHKARKESNRSGPWSLEISWGDFAAGRRLMRIRVFSDTGAARHIRRNATKADSYIKNPALRSTWAMDQVSR